MKTLNAQALTKRIGILLVSIAVYNALLHCGIVALVTHTLAADSVDIITSVITYTLFSLIRIAFICFTCWNAVLDYCGVLIIWWTCRALTLNQVVSNQTITIITTQVKYLV
jgi:hypothetical protein